MRIEYHRTLIADRVRNIAIYKALNEVIEPEKTTVADIGTGTGLLGLMAAKLGAKEVYLYEHGPVSDVAAQNLQANNAHQCQLLAWLLHRNDRSTPVDVIVCETLGNYPFEENIIDTLNDARQRMLKPEGVIIPSHVRQYAALVTTPRFFDELCIWDKVGFDIDLTPAKLKSLNNIYVRTFEPTDLYAPENSKAAEVQMWDEVNFSTDNRSSRKGEIQFQINKPANIYGVAVWWEADLTKSISISTAPKKPATHWEQLYFPVETAIKADCKDCIAVTICSDTSNQEGTHMTWTISHLDQNGNKRTHQMMDLDKGYID